MSATRTMGITVTDVGTTALLPLGFVYREPASGDNEGEKHWVYVYNDDSTDFAQGTIVMRDAGTTTYDALITTGATIPALRIMGVAQHAIAAGSYGFVQSKGIAEVLCNGSVSADTAICTSSTAGQAVDFADGAEEGVFGFATEIDAGAGTLITAMINCLG